MLGPVNLCESMLGLVGRPKSMMRLVDLFDIFASHYVVVSQSLTGNQKRCHNIIIRKHYSSMLFGAFIFGHHDLYWRTIRAWVCQSEEWQAIINYKFND